jgi:pimeloyl-ACP methyl ester carboxylesterase
MLLYTARHSGGIYAAPTGKPANPVTIRRGRIDAARNEGNNGITDYDRSMKKIYILPTTILLLFLLCAPSPAAGKEAPRKVIVLVHGFMDTRFHLYFMEKELIADGYVVINKTYPSASMSIEECADYLAGVIQRGTEDIKGPYELDFITHSMGGLVARCYLSRHRPPQAKRLVMIATPNRGVTKAELAARLPLADRVLGPALMEMAQGKDYLCGLCGGAPAIEFAVIAGGKGDGKGYSILIPGDDDGTVAVRSAYLPGAADFLLLDHIHNLICYYDDTIRNARAFIEEGAFLMHTAPPTNIN